MYNDVFEALFVVTCKGKLTTAFGKGQPPPVEKACGKLKASGASSCFFSKQDNCVLVGYRDGTLRSFDTITNKAQIWEISGAHRGAITAIYDSPTYLLTGGADGAVRVWSRSTH